MILHFKEKQEIVKLKAIILAGGFATRLRPLSCTRPKTLFPIVNKPLLQWIFERLVRNDIKEAILAVNRLTGFYIKEQKIPRKGLRVKFSYDPPRMPLGTAGPIKQAEQLIGQGEPFLVLNGDIFADLDYREIIQNHVKKGASATIALCEVEDPSRYGVAEIAEDERITRFIEKPPRRAARSNLINAGVYVLNPEVLRLIPQGRPVSMEREIFPKLVTDGRLFGHGVHGLWMDVGKPEEYLETNRILVETLSQKNAKGRYMLKNPVALDKGVSIGENAIIGPYAILGENVIVGKKAEVNGSVIFPRVRICDSARITGAIIGEDATIGEDVRVGRGCIIADHAIIRKGVMLEEDVCVCPAKEVTEKVLNHKTVR